MKFLTALLLSISAFGQTIPYRYVYKTTLASDITAGSTTIPVADAGLIDAGMTLVIAGDQMPVVSVTANDVTVTRTEGATSHSTGARIHTIERVRVDGTVFIGREACTSIVSGNSIGTNGYTTAGGMPVTQAQTSAIGTNTHTHICLVELPSMLAAGRDTWITGITFPYGVQGSNLGAQSASLANGTLNGTLVFSRIELPIPAFGQTPSAAAVRADRGSLTITPVNANVDVIAAGRFYTASFVPERPMKLNADLRIPIFRVTLQCAANSATTTNTPGFLVHYVTTAD